MMCVFPLQYSVTSIDPGNRVISAVSDEQEAKTEEILHCSFLAIIVLREEFKLDNKNNIYTILPYSRSITLIFSNNFTLYSVTCRKCPMNLSSGNYTNLRIQCTSLKPSLIVHPPYKTKYNQGVLLYIF